jgi:hypothetical protein
VFVKDQLPEQYDAYRDRTWRREPELRVETCLDAERWIESVGFCGGLTDVKRPGPSLFISVCGRRDAYQPRNVQKDPEASLAWTIKDEVIRNGRVYYAKLAKGRATFIAPRLVPHFNAIWGVSRRNERLRLSNDSRLVLKVLRKEWEMATSDLRKESGVTDRKRFGRAMDELQLTMKVVPGEVLYHPWFTYVWTLAEGRFPSELRLRIPRQNALREIAHAFLLGAGMTICGELARVTGLSRPLAGLGNRALVKKGIAERIALGVYRLKDYERLQVHDPTSSKSIEPPLLRKRQDKLRRTTVPGR